MKKQINVTMVSLLLTTNLLAQTNEVSDLANTTTAVVEKNPALLDQTRFSVGLQTATFKYSEPTINMKDTSQLSGIRLGMQTPGNQNRLVVSGDLEFLTGSASYDGAYQDGRKLQTSGKNSILTLRGLLGNQFEVNENSVLTPFVGIGIRQLANKYDGPGTYRREIGYTYLPLGLDWKTKMTSDWSAGFAAEYDLFLGGTVKTRLSDVDSSLPDIENKQSSGSGYRVSATIQYKIQNYEIGIQPFYHYWKIADSDKYIVTDGQITAAFYEPENETSITGIDLSLQF